MKGTKKILRLYRFHLQVICRQFCLFDFEFCVRSHSLRSAWRIAKSPISINEHLASLGFPNIKALKVYFFSCDILVAKSENSFIYLKSVNKIN